MYQVLPRAQNSSGWGAQVWEGLGRNLAPENSLTHTKSQVDTIRVCLLGLPQPLTVAAAETRRTRRTGWVLRGKRLDMISGSHSVHAVGHPVTKVWVTLHSIQGSSHSTYCFPMLNITVSVHDPQSGATLKLSELLNRIGTSCLLGWITSAEPSSGMCLCLGMHHPPGSRVYSSAQVWPTSAGHSFLVLCFLARLTWLTLAPQ